MNATRRILQQQQRQPMIRFIGQHRPPAKLDHTPQAHPASPTHALPESFATYRQKATQHGPLGGGQKQQHIGEHSGHSLGSVNPARGQYFDRDELPARFHRLRWSQAEIEAIESGGASLHA